MFKSILILLIAMCSIQVGASFAKKLFPLLGAASTSGLRLILATLILWTIFRPWKKKPNKDLMIYGASLGLMNLFFYSALERIPLGVAVALEFTGPLAVAILGSKKKVDYLWALLAGAGIYMLLPITSQSLDPLGITFALGAGFFWALYILFGKRAASGITGGVATAWGMMFAALVVLPFGAKSSLLDPAILPLGLFVAVLSSVIPYSLEMLALKSLPSRTFGVLMSVEPAIATIAGLLLLNEQLTVLQWAAILCVICSSLGSSLTSRPSQY